MGMIANIKTVARFEVKTLFRSWFFRVFSILTVLMLFGTNMGMLLDNNGMTGWTIKALSSNIPYFNAAFMNLAQAIIAIFLAADFLRRDKKLDTTEVIYTRSMTNWEYVWGKTIGVLIVFTALFYLVMLISLIINIVIPGVVVHWVGYLVYPALIALPTLIFTLGLAFFLMSVLRNQAVTMIILLGIAALSMFLFGNKIDHLFDYMAFSMPMMWSDFIGTGQNFLIIVHRLIYLSLGIAMILATVLLLKRLPQSRPASLAALILILVFTVTGAAGITYYWSNFSKNKKYAQELRSLNDEAKGSETINITDYTIDIDHQGYKILATAKLDVINDNDQPLNEVLFSLNPGLRITALKINGVNLQYQRNEHLITCSFNEAIQPGGEAEIQFEYTGNVDERICYLDIAEDKLDERHGPDFITTSQKRFAVLEDNCVLLTPESVWYPIAGWTFGSQLSVRPLRQFSNFNLSLDLPPDLVPVSQGSMEREGNKWIFTSETPLPGISLTAAAYEEQKIMVDSLELSYYYLHGHDVFTEHLPLITDTLPSLIKETLADYERQLGLDYPYNSLKFVETPVQFFAYNRIWTLTKDYVQPQVVLFPEKGSFLQRGNFKTEFDRSLRRSEERDDGRSEEEIQISIFNNFVRSNFVEGSPNFSVRMGMGGPSFSSDNSKPYLIFPNFFYFINRIESEEFQIINATLEAFMGEQSSEQMGFFRGMTGVSDDEQANLALAENSLSELLNMDDDKDVLPKVIKAKGTYLFSYLEALIGSDEFMEFLLELLQENRYRSIDVDVFSSRMESEYGVDLKSFLHEWFYGKEMSAFLVSDVSNFEIQSGDNTVYQVYFTVSNIGDTEGIINVTFRTGGRGGPGGRGGGMGRGGFGMAGRDQNTERLYSIPARSSKRIGIVMDDQIRMMSVNTLISSNLPSNISYPFPEVEQRNNLEAFEGILETDLVTSLVQPGEIIVDNEDQGFAIYEEGGSNRLTKWLKIDQKESEFKYQGMNFWWGAPLTWTATAQSSFYGEVIRSAYYVRSGEGNNYVTWTTEIEEEGYYNVSCYLDDMIKRMGRSRSRGGDRGRGGPGGPGGGEDIKDEYHFTVVHSDGDEEVILAIKNIEDGWNSLGSYYFNKGRAIVKLSDKNVGRMVIADAIKWVKQ